MKIILSPAKSINFDIVTSKNEPTMPQFLSEAEYLVNKLKKMSASQIGKLMSVSPQIAHLNVERFQNWSLPFTNENSRPVADIFTGAAYQGLDFPSLNKKEREYAQNTLRILSGLYGVLKPLDLVQPYRLEMGTSLQVTPNTKNLYQYWDTKILDALNDELTDNDVLVNLASNEYFKAAKLTNIKAKIVTPIFKDMAKNGDYKVIMTYAKKARGLMTRFIIQNEIDNSEGLKAFDSEGYYFSANESSNEEFVFRRG